ncbi:hypothetical protein NDU88_008521 [Pleurodeles waltl]|uniref:Uncharacterized protein n=1 Tax=Pleurodeles waltl TaxID=8319 RepID=A0AAV7RXX3_PLEWA|nr:hypothetical protein NDU88_008521 [Pleurodeles waltl]
MFPPQIFVWGPGGLKLKPSDLVAGGEEKELEQPRAGLLVLPRGAGLGARASRPAGPARFEYLVKCCSD